MIEIPGLLVSALELLAFTFGATLVWYPTAVLVGGGGVPGEENVMIGQMAIGFLLLGLVFTPW